MKIITHYVPKMGYQPTCTGLDEQGELQWLMKMKEPWHQKMFPVKYRGDLSEQWMRLSLAEKGCYWL